MFADDEFSPSETDSDRDMRQQSAEERYLGRPEERRAHHHPGHHHHHRGHGPGVPTPLIFLAPLAGIAALYAMAFINTNPALLTLATISGRKKRSVSFNNLDLIGADLDRDEEGAEYVREVGILSRFLASNPGLDFGDQRDLLMAGVLQCSSIGSSQCLDALVCEYSRYNSRFESWIPFYMLHLLLFSYNDVEKDTVAMVLYHLLASSHIDNDMKSRIRIAAGLGRQDHCSLYTCELNLQLS